ncbi:ABC transporter permease [Mesorhizobium delmotii]|uniref:Binding-protein-dependent transport systems inner membrane component n=1 Tax=Mesorhizobium delmotii TaxID=1631247 RepID=A0A2P9AG76_9HYPH|nr:ABC transporter permease [Mesorhizobium delmotii]SJM30143.1 Binding-protein-dependent transport systems inner membrane component [Mesorhizobium delmotii]
MTDIRLNLPLERPFTAAIPVRSWVGIGILAVLALLVCAAPLLTSFGEGQIISDESFAFPANAGWLGTDHLGRDLWSRLLYGGRFTLLIALVTTVITFLAGAGIGFFSGLAGGLVDDIIGRTVDAVLSIPSIILALLVINALGTSIPTVVGIVALIEACRVFRLARALALQIGALDYVDAARARGESLLWLAVREVLPNATGMLAAEFGLRFTYIILFISALSFIGLGVQPPTADWGVMVRENSQGLLYGSPAALLPAAAIAVVTISINLIIDGFVERDQGNRTPEMLP